jgi:1,5-anhydro-D-fructose reductase (1,5-anhydro-D-mannitol-forming)
LLDTGYRWDSWKIAGTAEEKMKICSANQAMNKIIRWGIIGCGDVTEVKSGPGFQKADGSTLVAVMRRDAACAKDYASRHNVPRWYADADELIADREVDAIYVATPPSSHKEYVLKTARAGKPVLVEKPMALSAMECETMIVACRQAGVPLRVAYYRRKLPRFEKMREIIQSGVIGVPRAVAVRQFMKQDARLPQHWKVDLATNGGGLFVDMQTHVLDWLHHAFGSASETGGVAVNAARIYGVEDTVSYSLLFKNGVVASGLFAYSSACEEESVTVYGSEGEVSTSFFRPAKVRLVRDGGEEIFQLPDPPHVHQPLIQAFVDELKGGPVLNSTGETALETACVIDEILYKYRTLPPAPI